MHDNNIRTQISGKYSPENVGVFKLREKLMAAGIGIAFPVGASIIQYVLEFAVTVPHEATTPFHETEVEFFKEIKNNPVQITYNLNGDNEGYMGESTSVETAYALLCNKPIIIARPIKTYSDRLDNAIKTIVSKYEDRMLLANIDEVTVAEAKLVIERAIQSTPDYQLTKDEVDEIIKSAQNLTIKYKDTWEEYLFLQSDSL